KNLAITLRVIHRFENEYWRVELHHPPVVTGRLVEIDDDFIARVGRVHLQIGPARNVLVCARLSPGLTIGVGFSLLDNEAGHPRLCVGWPDCQAEDYPAHAKG